MQYGSRINGRLVNLPATLGLTKSGEMFEIYADTQGISDESMAITQLLTLEQKMPDLKVLYVETNPLTGRITLQIIDAGPGQFMLETVLAWLPQLLIISGVVIAALFVFGLIPAFQTLPGWIWYVAVIGGALLVSAWLMGALKVTRPEIATLAERKTTERKRRTEEERKEAEEKREEEIAKAAIERTEKQVGVVRDLTEQLVVASDKVKDCEREKNREGAKAKPSQRKLETLDEQCQKLEQQAQNLAFRINKETEIFSALSEKSEGVKASTSKIHEVRQIRRMKEKAGQDTSREDEWLAEQVS